MKNQKALTVCHHEFWLEMTPNLMMLLTFDTVIVQKNSVMEIFIEIVRISPELSHCCNFHVSW